MSDFDFLASVASKKNKTIKKYSMLINISEKIFNFFKQGCLFKIETLIYSKICKKKKAKPNKTC